MSNDKTPTQRVEHSAQFICGNWGNEGDHLREFVPASIARELAAELELAQAENAKLRRDVSEWQKFFCCDHSLSDQLIALQDENAALRKDAARYKWLCEQGWFSDLNGNHTIEFFSPLLGGFPRDAIIDDAIRAAMKQTEGKR